jgi:hypothetical protein
VADQFFDLLGAYFYQAHDEFGFPAVTSDHIDDLMLFNPPSPEEGIPPTGSNPDYDPSAMADVAQWVATDGARLMFIYGEFDPWTAGAFDLGAAEDSYIFVAPAGTHGARFGRLDTDDMGEAMDILELWTGVVPALPPAAKVSPERFPPWGRF